MEQHKVLYNTFPFLADVDANRQRQFEEYFRTAPMWLLEAFQIEEMEKDHVFVREGEPADMVYFIGKGVIEAVDYRFYGITYEFMRFDNCYAMGGMEYIMDLDTYRTTLRTITKCTVAKIPMQVFAKWMSSDIKALKREANLVGHYLLEDGRRSRALLFMHGTDRLAMLFTERYSRYADHGVLYVKGSQQDLSNATGLSVKTINRSIKKFAEDGLITKVGTQISVDGRQYQMLKDMVDTVVESEEE